VYTADLPPVIAGRYAIEGLLGGGSLARVVRARDARTGGAVALKLLHANLREDAGVVDRFRREVQIVRRVRHPHVIRIDDVVEDGPWLALVMELHEGGDLADRIARRGPLSLDELEALCAQVGGALEAAHRAGVVHRDLKPQNVLVGGGALDGLDVPLDVRLADFGLARTADASGLTTRTTALGTPEYMAPELITEGQVDPRADLYAFGILLFEAATGRLPFVGDTPFSILRQHVDEAPPRARALRPELPPRMDEAIARALAKDPLDRFPSAAALVAAFRGEEGAGVLAPVPSGAAAGRCQRCGGALLRGIDACVECGAARLTLRRERRGLGVLVTGPGKTAEKLDGAGHVALVKLLEELPPETASIERLRKAPPRLPFFVATGLDAPSAERLRDRLVAIGFEARAVRPGLLGPRELRKKTWRLGGRTGLIGLGSLAAFNPVLSNHAPLLVLSAWPLACVLGIAVGVRRSLRPVVDRRAGGEAASLDAGSLSAALPRLARRSDRRLVARLLGRLELLRGLGHAGLGAPLGERAAEAVEALVALDEAARAVEAAGRGPAGGLARALDELREEERARAALVADLLRGLGRLDLLCARLARAGARAAALEQADAAQLAAELAIELEAEEDVAALLRGPS
jgi:hypothetical protein